MNRCLLFKQSRLLLCGLCILAGVAVSSMPASNSPPGTNNFNTWETTHPVLVEGHVYRHVKTDMTGRVRQTPVSDALVYLASAEGVDFKTPDRPVVVHVKNGQVEPPFACVVVGQKLIVEILDAREHDLFIETPTEPGCGRLVPNDPHKTRYTEVFSRPTLFGSLIRAIDPHVHGTFAVLPSPIFAHSGEKGQYRLPMRLPTGHKYELRAFKYGVGVVKIRVEIAPTEEKKTVDFVFPARD